MKNSKGFTLIELLAVIVILAIIALIATPIILNVIDTARKGSKESSTLGYIDAVEKQVMLSQVDSSATMIPSGTYTVEQLNNLKVEVKGEKPDNTSVLTINNKGAVSEGWFTYSGTNYKIYYNGSKAVASTTEDYVDENGNKHNEIATPGEVSGGGSSTPSIPTIDSCPDCVYAYTTDTWYYSGTPTTLTSDQYKANYEDVVSASGKNYFLGMKLNATGTIERAYACGIKDGVPFCIEGSTDGSTYNANKTLLQSASLYNNGCFNLGSAVDCSGSMSAYADSDGIVGMGGVSAGCFAYNNGGAHCN